MVAPFENDPKIRRDFSNRSLCIMADILNCKKNETYLSELSRITGVKSTNLIKIVEYLKKIKVIKKTKDVGRVSFFKINKALLKHFIDEQEDYFVNNFHKKHNKVVYRNPNI